MNSRKRGRQSTGREKERGVALVLVLGLVALVAVWAVESASEDWISLRRAENMQLASQAMLAAESGLELGRKILKEDDAGVDSLDEDWAIEALPFSVDGGVVAATIVDANRAFNLNDLVDGNGVPQAKAVLIAKRLFVRLELDAVLVDALVDWVDNDDAPYGPGGAEDIAYMDKHWRVKNAPLDSLREVLLINGFDLDVLNKLRPVAVAWPHVGITSVNINTAVKDVLMSLADNIPEQDVDEMIAQRKDAPWRTVAEWSAQRPYSVWAGRINPARLGTVSDAFLIQSEARFGRVRWGEEMLMGRSGKKLQVLARRKIVAQP